MIALVRHIESLLLKHDCVIVPDFGGFVTQQVSARFVEEEGLFLPPYRSVGFNGSLTLNDGLLVQSYMNAYGIGYVEALQQIASVVAEVKAELHTTGSYELGSIGVFTLTLNGTYDFQPCEAGVVSPELYGLDAFVMRKQEEKAENVAQTIVEEPLQTATKFIERSETHYTIRIRREVANYVAAAVVMLVCFFAWSVPVSNTSEASVQQAALFSSQLFATPEEMPRPVLSPATTFVDESDVVEEKQDSVVVASVAEPVEAERIEVASQPEASKVVASPQKQYTLVVCSCVPQKNAEALVAELQSVGIQEVEIFVKKDILRVVVGTYPSESDALVALREYRKINKSFADAWVLKK